MSEDSVQLKIQDMQFECTFCKNTNFIKKVLSIKADGDNSFGFGKSTERVQAAVCTKCGYTYVYAKRDRCF
jgi:predicted nucleic-acid-binding Zn-ribbon protein